MATTIFGMFRGARQDDPLASAKAVTAWAAGWPAKDPLGTLEAVVRLLEDASTTQPAATLSRVQALLALDRLTLPIQAEILAQYRLPSLSEDVRRRLWHAGNDLARWLAYTYEQAGGVAPPREGERKPPQLAAPGIFSRLFYYRGLQARLGLLHYESWIPGNWKTLHSAYREACAQGVATEPFTSGGPAEPGGGGCSAEQEYLQILLLQRVNSGNLTANQVEWAAQWLRTWARMLNLSEPPAAGDGYWLDSGRGDGLLGKRPEAPEGELLYLDVRPLHEQVGAQIALLRQQVVQSAGQPVQRTLEEQLNLARRLDQLWLPQALPRARRGERRAEKRAVVVAAGWKAMMAAMRTGGIHRQHEPHHYTYDDATNFTVRGVRKVERDQYGNVIERGPNRHGWQLQDTSDSGARILSATKEAQQQQVGALLALQPDGETQWRLGIVRRLRRRTSENTELGVEIIAQNASMTLVAPISTRGPSHSVEGIDTASGNPGFHALYLPPQQYTRGTPVRSLVLPAGEFAPGRRLLLRVERATFEIRLFVLLEQGADWVWTSFEVQAAAMPA